MNRTIFSTKNRILISRVLAVSMFVLLGLSAEGWQTTAPLVGAILSILGWTLVGIGMTGRIWSSSYISGRKSSELVMLGPYSISRNPLYFFSFVAGVGIMLVTETLFLPVLFSVFFLLYYRPVIVREEEKLARLHPAAFTAYCAAVPRFWPNPMIYSEPASYTVSSAEFRNSLTDIVWFAVAGGAIEFLETMHVSGVVPTFLTIY